MSRGRSLSAIPSEHADLEKWPKPDESSLDEADLSRYQRNTRAIKMFAEGRSWASIGRETRLGRSSVRALVLRALKSDGNAQIFGFFAAVPRLRLKPYNRKASQAQKHAASKGGMAGLLHAVFRDYPTIRTELKKVVLKYAGPNDATPGTVPWYKVLGSFHQLCRAEGIPATAWPFSATYLGYESVRRWGHKILYENRGRGARITLGPRANKMLGATTGEQSLLLAEQYGDIWELDSHKINAVGTIKISSPDGAYTLVAIKLIYIVLIADRDSHSIVSWIAALNEEPSAADILRCVDKAINTWEPLRLTIPGLSRDPQGGMPSYNFPALRNCGCALLLVDNASAHLARDVEKRIRETLGCTINFGEVATPNRRPLIEAINGQLARLGFKRLVSATATDSEDQNGKTAVERAILHEVTRDDLFQFIDCLVWRINGMPTAGLGQKSPLEKIEMQVSNEHFIAPQLPSAVMKENTMRTVVELRKLAGNPLQGRNLHINVDGARYTSHSLINSGLLPGISISVEINEDDMTTVKASITGKGLSLGVLKAIGGWGRTKHDRPTRKIIIRLKHKRLLRLIDGQDPVDAYMQYLVNKAAAEPKTSKPKASKAATALSRAEQVTGANIPSPEPITRRSRPVAAVKKVPLKNRSKSVLGNFSK